MDEIDELGDLKIGQCVGGGGKVNKLLERVWMDAMAKHPDVPHICVGTRIAISAERGNITFFCNTIAILARAAMIYLSSVRYLEVCQAGPLSQDFPALEHGNIPAGGYSSWRR